MSEAIKLNLLWTANYIFALIIAPLMIGIINKVKAFFAGRRGPRLLQLYYDLFKLLNKSAVYSQSVNWIFKLTPWAMLAITMFMLLLLPAGGIFSPAAFAGDLILFVYLAGCSRMLMVLAAMTTGSAFEGMGASRECQFSALCEVVLAVVLVAIVMLSDDFTLSGALTGITAAGWLSDWTVLLFLGVAFYIVMLCENCRVPFDDPETHLELTMIHEAMILDNSGPDLAAIHYAAAVKLFIFLSFLASLLLPELEVGAMAKLLLHYGVIFILTISVGIVESVMARCRFLKVPQLLSGAFAIAIIAIVLAAIFVE